MIFDLFLSLENWSVTFKVYQVFQDTGETLPLLVSLTGSPNIDLCFPTWSKGISASLDMCSSDKYQATRLCLRLTAAQRKMMNAGVCCVSMKTRKDVYGFRPLWICLSRTHSCLNCRGEAGQVQAVGN